MWFWVVKTVALLAISVTTVMYTTILCSSRRREVADVLCATLWFLLFAAAFAMAMAKAAYQSCDPAAGIALAVGSVAGILLAKSLANDVVAMIERMRNTSVLIAWTAWTGLGYIAYLYSFVECNASLPICWLLLFAALLTVAIVENVRDAFTASPHEQMGGSAWFIVLFIAAPFTTELTAHLFGIARWSDTYIGLFIFCDLSLPCLIDAFFLAIAAIRVDSLIGKITAAGLFVVGVCGAVEAHYWELLLKEGIAWVVGGIVFFVLAGVLVETICMRRMASSNAQYGRCEGQECRGDDG